MIEKEGDFYAIPCREWAAMHLGRKITHRYRTKSNALRAVRDPSRNLVTCLCKELLDVYTRLAQCELILFRIYKQAGAYDTSIYVREPVGDAGIPDGDDISAGGGNTGSGGSAGGAATGDGFTAETAGSSDGRDAGTD